MIMSMMQGSGILRLPGLLSACRKSLPVDCFMGINLFKSSPCYITLELTSQSAFLEKIILGIGPPSGSLESPPRPFREELDSPSSRGREESRRLEDTCKGPCPIKHRLEGRAGKEGLW